MMLFENAPMSGGLIFRAALLTHPITSPDLPQTQQLHICTMPKSIRRQAEDAKLLIQKGVAISKDREKALRLLREGKHSVRTIAVSTNVSKSTASRMSQCLSRNDEEGVQKIVSAARRGRRHVLTVEEESTIVQRLVHAAKEGAPVRNDALKSMMIQVASDGRPAWKNGIPSDAALRSFRARHSELTVTQEKSSKSLRRIQTSGKNASDTGEAPGDSHSVGNVTRC